MLRCTECKGTNVQVAMWVRPNTRQILDDFGSFDHTDTKWCDDCQDHVLLEEFEPPEITPEQLKEMRDNDVPLREHPRVGWCGYEIDYCPCGEYVYQTYSGQTCERGHQGPVLEEDPHRD